MLDIDTKLSFDGPVLVLGYAKSTKSVFFCVIYVWHSTMFDIQYVV